MIYQRGTGVGFGKLNLMHREGIVKGIIPNTEFSMNRTEGMIGGVRFFRGGPIEC